MGFELHESDRLRGNPRHYALSGESGGGDFTAGCGGFYVEADGDRFAESAGGSLASASLSRFDPYRRAGSAV